MTSLLTPVPPAVRDRLRLEIRPRQAAAPARRCAAAGVIALVGSVLAAYVLAHMGRAVFTVPSSFDKFNFSGYAVLTAIGVIVAAVGWPITQRITRSPRWLYRRAALATTVVLLIPDVWLLTQPGNPTGPVVTLMVMHVAIAVVTYVSMTRIADTSGGGNPRRQHT